MINSISNIAYKFRRNPKVSDESHSSRPIKKPHKHENVVNSKDYVKQKGKKKKKEGGKNKRGKKTASPNEKSIEASCMKGPSPLKSIPSDQALPAKKPSRRLISKEKSINLDVTKQFFKQIIETKKPVKESKQRHDRDSMPAKLKERKGEKDRKKMKDERTAQDGEFVNNENEGNMFDENGQPFWCKVLFDEQEANKDGIELEGRLTAEHVLSYLEGNLILQVPPDDKPPLDWTEMMDVMKGKDETYFNEDAVIYHTLRNIIQCSQRALQRCTSQGNDDNNNGRGQIKNANENTDNLETAECDDIRFDFEKTIYVTYDRKRPIESIAKYMKILKRSGEKFSKEYE